MQHEYAKGIEASPSELIRARPDRSVTGFAPGGRVSTHLWGANRSVFRGRGMEYAESRAYQPGDEPRAIDWRLTARSDTTYTKLYHEERERPVYLLIDMRKTMHFGTRKRFKSHLAAEVAAMLAWTGHDGGDRVGATILSRAGLVEVAPSRSRPALLALLKRVSDATLLDAEPAEAVPDMATSIKRLTKVCRPGSLVFVVSDFADLDAATEREFRRLTRRATVTCISIHDRMEEALPTSGGRLSDGNGAIGVTSLSRAARERHRATYNERNARLNVLAGRLGMSFHILSTEDDAETILYPHKRRAAA